MCWCKCWPWNDSHRLCKASSSSKIILKITYIFWALTFQNFQISTHIRKKGTWAGFWAIQDLLFKNCDISRIIFNDVNPMETQSAKGFIMSCPLTRFILQIIQTFPTFYHFGDILLHDVNDLVNLRLHPEGHQEREDKMKEQSGASIWFNRTFEQLRYTCSCLCFYYFEENLSSSVNHSRLNKISLWLRSVDPAVSRGGENVLLDAV